MAGTSVDVCIRPCFALRGRASTGRGGGCRQGARCIVRAAPLLARCPRLPSSVTSSLHLHATVLFVAWKWDGQISGSVDTSSWRMLLRIHPPCGSRLRAGASRYHALLVQLPPCGAASPLSALCQSARSWLFARWLVLLIASCLRQHRCNRRCHCQWSTTAPRPRGLAAYASAYCCMQCSALSATVVRHTNLWSTSQRGGVGGSAFGTSTGFVLRTRCFARYQRSQLPLVDERP
jgi:hypothetical protein